MAAAREARDLWRWVVLCELSVVLRAHLQQRQVTVEEQAPLQQAQRGPEVVSKPMGLSVEQKMMTASKGPLAVLVVVELDEQWFSKVARS